jgi:hypothetical protein
MPDIVADFLDLCCSLLLSGSRIQEFQLLGPDPSGPRARDPRACFSNGTSGNPRARPSGIRNFDARV